MADLPTGTVTFLFTDIEGSTKLLHELGDAYADALAEHRRVLREAFTRHGGIEVDTQGDAFFYAFPSARDALAAAADGQAALADGPIRVRMGVHTGEPVVTDEGYVGMDVHRGARIAGVAHGGQVVFSARTFEDADVGAVATDIGRHRLKDLTEPERLYQLGDRAFPPLRSLNATNLPVQPEPLIGRERELAEVLELVRDARLVTLTGAGGSGKTRLALQAAADLVDDFKDGVFWVSLAAVTDPALVLPTAAAAVGGADDLGDYVGEKRLLLLLDNLEQVLACAPELADLLSRCPNLRLLATSRAPLRISAEQQYDVPPLPEREARELFALRARRIDPSFVPDDNVAEICRRLDGLPLALELVAARVKLLTTQQILARLVHGLDLGSGSRDLPSRQQTLRATIEWSYELLGADERDLFARLAVFSGSFDLAAAEAVCDAAPDAVEALLDNSLIRRTETGRFFMLETIGEYARELLSTAREVADLRERHRKFFLDLAEATMTHVRGPDAAATLDGLDTEHANFQAAIQTALEDGSGETALRLTGALHPFWYLRAHYSVARALSEQALAAAPAVSADVLVRALGGAAEFALVQGDFVCARAFLEERRGLCERSEPSRMASTLTLLGHLEFMEGDVAGSEELYRQALARDREAPAADPWLDRATALSNLGWAQLWLERFDEAEETLTEGLGVAIAGADDVGRARIQNNLARVALARGDDTRAESLATSSLAALRSLRDEQAIAECFDILACVAARRRDGRRAAGLAGSRDALLEDLGDLGEAQLVPDGGVLERIRAELGDAWNEAWERGRSLTPDEAIADVLSAGR